MVMNKKGQELTLGTIILIVLGIVVLVFLIYGFSSGWNNLWQKLTGLGGGKVNVDTMKTACELACTQSSEYSFCKELKTVVLEDGAKGIGSCRDFSEAEVVFSDNKGKLNVGIEPCSNLCSARTPDEQWALNCRQQGGEIKTSTCTKAIGSPSASGQFCCSIK